MKSFRFFLTIGEGRNKPFGWDILFLQTVLREKQTKNLTAGERFFDN